MVTEFVESSTETRSGFRVFETAHGSISSLDPTMVLLDPIIVVLVGAMFYAFLQFSPDRARITIVTVRRDTRGGDAGHGFGGSVKRLRRLHVAGLAQPDVDERTETINRAIKVAPSAVHFDVRLVNVPAFAEPALAPTPKVVDQGWRQLRFPRDYERDHVGRVLGPVHNSATPFVELL